MQHLHNEIEKLREKLTQVRKFSEEMKVKKQEQTPTKTRLNNQYANPGSKQPSHYNSLTGND